MNKIVGLAIAGAAATGITATAIVKGRGSSSAEGEGSSIKASFIPNRNFATAYKNKYGGSYGKYLAGPDTSEDWWRNKYQEIKSSISQSKGFERVTKGFGVDDSSLNKVCEKAYNYSDPEADDNGHQPAPTFDKATIWRLCSDNKTRPKSIYEYNFDTPQKSGTDKEEYKSESKELTIGESHSTKLASIKHSGNQWFWELKGEEFFSDPEIIKRDSFFGSQYTANQSTSNKAKVVKDSCEKAYKQIEGHSKDGYADFYEIFKWCSFSGEYQSPSA